MVETGSIYSSNVRVERAVRGVKSNLFEVFKAM